jgi:hypothetical protein
MPFLEGLRLGQVVEGIVDFNGVKVSGVVFEPFILREILRIEPTYPVVIMPT